MQATEDLAYSNSNEENENAKIFLSFNPSVLNLKLNNNKFIMKCFGIDTKKYITCEITIETHANRWENFPRIEIFQSGDISDQARQANQYNFAEVTANRTKFGIGWSIKQRCVDYWKKNWPFYRYEGEKTLFFQSFWNFIYNS